MLGFSVVINWFIHSWWNFFPAYLYHACLVAQLCPTLCNPMDCSHQAPLSMWFFGQQYWSGLPFLPPGDLLSPMDWTHLLHLLYWQAGCLPLSHLGSLCWVIFYWMAKTVNLTFLYSGYFCFKQSDSFRFCFYDLLDITREVFSLGLIIPQSSYLMPHESWNFSVWLLGQTMILDLLWALVTHDSNCFWWPFPLP